MINMECREDEQSTEGIDLFAGCWVFTFTKGKHPDSRVPLLITFAFFLSAAVIFHPRLMFFSSVQSYSWCHAAKNNEFDWFGKIERKLFL